MAIKIAHINVARGYRGGERQTELLIRELAKHGLEQVLVARRGEALARRLHDAPIDIRTVNGSPLSVLKPTAGAEIVHAHEGRSAYSAYLRWLLFRTPYVITRHVDNPIRSVFGRGAYLHASRVVAVAPQVADVVKGFEPRVRIQVIHASSSSLSVDRAKAREIRSSYPGKFLVGHVAALDNAQKGQEYIITVARELQVSHPDVQFVLVGGGDDEAMLRRLAAGLTNLVFTRFVDNVGDYLAAFDIFILPSNREGIGSILLDAMDQQLPVIASRVGGVPEIVRDGENGLLIDSRSPEQLRAAILRLRGDAELGRKLGAAGQKLAKPFNAVDMARRYLDVYRSVLGKHD